MCWNRLKEDQNVSVAHAKGCMIVQRKWTNQLINWRKCFVLFNLWPCNQRQQLTLVLVHARLCLCSIRHPFVSLSKWLLFTPAAANRYFGSGCVHSSSVISAVWLQSWSHQRTPEGRVYLNAVFATLRSPAFWYLHEKQLVLISLSQMMGICSIKQE